MRRWRRLDARRVQDCRVFGVDRVSYRHPDRDRDDAFFVVDAPDWINVVPLTPEGRIVMVRQFRFGIDEFTLEIPGGMCDPGESPIVTAARELREETGYASDPLTELGWVHANPAIQSNRLWTYLAPNARRVGEPDPDEHEEFEIVEIDRQAVAGLVNERKITHALVVSALWMLEDHER